MVIKKEKNATHKVREMTERERERERVCYLIFSLIHRTRSPVVVVVNDVIIPPVKSVQIAGFTQRLIAPPTAPQVSGRVIQASVWTPRSIHWLRDRSTLTA